MGIHSLGGSAVALFTNISVLSDSMASPAAVGILLVKMMADSAVSMRLRLSTTEAPTLRFDQMKSAMVRRMQMGRVTCTHVLDLLHNLFGSCVASFSSILIVGE